MKKIIFKAESELSDWFDFSPVPAKQVLPEWYKKTSRFLQGDKKPGLSLLNAGANNTTVKACMPFYDALTSGYVFTLPLDLEFRKVDGNILIRWKTDQEAISMHDKEQAPLLPKPFGNEQGVIFKFEFDYQIKTPPGYSVLFTHPLNQHDLPFRSFSGIVETDTYPLPVIFPFQVLDIFEDIYIVKKGTPVIQMIPIKRENWQKTKEKYDKADTKKRRIYYLSKIVNAYKSRFWVKKSYN